MYGIFTYIYHKHIQKNLPNVGEYTSPMDGMGILGGLFVERSLFTSPHRPPIFSMVPMRLGPGKPTKKVEFFSPPKKVGLFHPPGSSIRNLFWVFYSWPFQGWKRDLHWGDQKATWKKLAVTNFWGYLYRG